MKRLLLAIVILAAGTGTFGSLRMSTDQLARETAVQREALQAQGQQISEMRRELDHAGARTRELRQALRAADTTARDGRAGEWLNLARLNPDQLSAEQNEALLAELGFDWNTTGDYVVVSKSTLESVSLPAMEATRLTDTLCRVLAITPAERAALDATADQLAANYRAWMEHHVERAGPREGVMFEYRVAFDDAFSLSQSNLFVSRAYATLGEERGKLLQEYADQWLGDVGARGGEPATLSVSRQGTESNPTYMYTVKSGNSNLSTMVNPWQPFPEAFKPLFPGGWRELAAREEFPLPKSFEKR